MADVGTRVMTGHGMVGVAKKRSTIFGRYAGCAQAARERMPKVMDTNLC